MGIIKIVMVGEVDSGKSTLIGRLLYDTDSLTLGAREEFKKTCKDLGKDLEFAYLLDSFEEERKEEFTLDTTQALLKTQGKEFLLIDVPGHKELLKNMLTGISYADAAVLVVDINKSLEEQTKRHLYILRFLGIDTVAIVVNKIDTVNYNQDRFIEVRDQAIGFLGELGIKSIQIMPICAKDGQNLISRAKSLNWYTGPTFMEALLSIRKKEEGYDFRFPVQDVYKIKDKKITVGMIASGKVKKGDLLKVLPSNVSVKLKAIKVFNRVKPEASSGDSVGLLFNPFNEEIKRGQVVYNGRPPIQADRIQAKLFCLSALNVNEILSVYCATQETLGKISSIKECLDTTSWKKSKNPDSLKPFDAADVVVDLQQLLVVESFYNLPALGRFLLKRNNEICAIGIIDQSLN